MRRIAFGAMLVALTAAFAAGIAMASHSSVGVGIYMGFDSAENLHYEGSTQCTSSGAATPCQVNVALGGRDYGRFVRACGYDSSPNPAVVIQGQSTSANAFCNGHRNFQVRWFAFTDATSDHANGVWVNLVVTRR